MFCVGMVCPVCRCPGAPCVPFVLGGQVLINFDVVLDQDCFRRMVSKFCVFYFVCTKKIISCSN